MKRGIIFFIFIALLGFTSCTQEYICQCTVSYEGTQPGLPEPEVQEFGIKDKHDIAEKKCSDNSTVIKTNGITMREECQLY